MTAQYPPIEAATLADSSGLPRPRRRRPRGVSIVSSTTLNLKKPHSCTATSTMRRRAPSIGSVLHAAGWILISPGAPRTRSDGGTMSSTAAGKRSKNVCCASRVFDAETRAMSTASGRTRVFMGIPFQTFPMGTIMH